MKQRSKTRAQRRQMNARVAAVCLLGAWALLILAVVLA